MSEVEGIGGEAGGHRIFKNAKEALRILKSQHTQDSKLILNICNISQETKNNSNSNLNGYKFENVKYETQGNANDSKITNTQIDSHDSTSEKCLNEKEQKNSNFCYSQNSIKIENNFEKEIDKIEMKNEYCSSHQKKFDYKKYELFFKRNLRNSERERERNDLKNNLNLDSKVEKCTEQKVTEIQNKRKVKSFRNGGKRSNKTTLNLNRKYLISQKFEGKMAHVCGFCCKIFTKLFIALNHVEICEKRELPPEEPLVKISNVESSNDIKSKTIDDSVLFYNESEYDDSVYCICKGRGHGVMVECCNKLCKGQWFHFPCVNLRTKPKGYWVCPECSKSKGASFSFTNETFRVKCQVPYCR